MRSVMKRRTDSQMQLNEEKFFNEGENEDEVKEEDSDYNSEDIT